MSELSKSILEQKKSPMSGADECDWDPYPDPLPRLLPLTGKIRSTRSLMIDMTMDSLSMPIFSQGKQRVRCEDTALRRALIKAGLA